MSFLGTMTSEITHRIDTAHGMESLTVNLRFLHPTKHLQVSLTLSCPTPATSVSKKLLQVLQDGVFKSQENYIQQPIY